MKNEIKNNYIGQKVLVRGTSSGVYYGTLVAMDGPVAELAVRR